MVFKDLPHLACYNHPPYLPWFSYSGLIDLIKASRNSLCSGCSLCLEWSFPIYHVAYSSLHSKFPECQLLNGSDIIASPQTHTLLISLLTLMFLYCTHLLHSVKHLSTMWEIQVQSLDRGDLLEKEMATHSSILAWKIPWMENPGRLQSMGLQESDATEWLHFHFYFPYTKLHYLFICHDYCLSSPIKICWKVLTE